MRVDIRENKLGCVAVDKVLLFGEPQTLCVMANTVAGKIERYQRDKKGHLIYNPNTDMPLTEVVYGKVEITFNEGWSMVGDVYYYKGEPA